MENLKHTTMKRILFLAVAVFALLGCSKEDSAPEGALNPEEASNNPVFYAGFENSSNGGTKVYADENMRLKWNAADHVSIFVYQGKGNTLNSEYAFAGEDGDAGGMFTPVPSSVFGTGAELDHIYAVYPYSIQNTIDHDGVMTLYLPSEQTYKEGSFGIGANTMVAVTDDTFLPFKNVCGYLKLSLWGDNIKIRSIKLEGNNGEKLAGKATVVPGTEPAVTMDGSATESITLYGERDVTGAPIPVPIGSSSAEATDFYLVVPPTAFSGGFTITVTDEYGGVFVKTTTKSNPITRNNVKPMPAMEVTPDYTGINVEFSDPAFKAYCVANYDSNSDGEISLDEAKAAVSMNLRNAADEITSLGGLEYFTNLVSLDITSHNITNVPLNTLVKLKGFTCYFNHSVQQLDFSGNTALTQIDIVACENLTTLVSDNPALVFLRCMGYEDYPGRLSTLSLLNNPALESLDVRQNELTSIDLSHCPVLSSFMCFENQLESLDLSSNPKLDQVGASDNQLTSITISGTANPKLRFLDLANNSFTGTLTINNMPSLVTLIVDGCSDLRILSAKKNVLQYLGVNACPELIEIDCGFNQLDSLGLAGAPSLQYLSCDDNKLTSLDVSQNMALVGLNCYFNELKTLDVSSNSNLENIGAWDNKLVSIKVSPDNSNLKRLNIANNFISSPDSLDLPALSGLETLYCENNGLTSLDVTSNTNLTYLTCYDNHLSSLDLSQNTKLGGLVCYNNALTSLDLSANHQLDQLECYNNNLTSLDVSNLTKLYIFSCFGNNITTLDVSNNGSLRYLAAWPQQNTLTTVKVKAGATTEYMLGQGKPWPTINPADYGTTIVEVP